MYTYNGEYSFTKEVITNWRSSATGVYFLFEGTQIVYVGSAVSDEGIRGRLLQHINERNFPYVTNFGYKAIAGKDAVLAHELAEIKRLQPKHNTVGKSYGL